MSFLKSFPAFVLLGLSSTVHAAIGPITDLPIVNANIQPDGFTRPAVLAGGTFPGPIIKGNKGDHFEINVIDRLTNEDMLKSTSIHWHGMFQHTTAWADGPAFVTQCPITTGNSFNYNFHVPGQAGTYWYHSHLATQYCDGLRGPLIIYDPADPQKHLYDIDDDSTVLTLADWYHTLARQEPAGIPPVPDSTLINGLGRFPSQTTPSPLAVIKVQHGKRYRFRLINIACDPNYHFSIDGHNLTVIETDGINTQPITVSSLTIFVAQRYSFILNANQPIGNYWIRAQPNNAADTSFNGGLNSAILRYIGAPAKDPNTTQGADPTPLNEVNLHPLKPSPVPGKRHPSGGDFNKNLVLTFVNGLFEIDGVSFIPPTVPVLLQILSGAQTAQSIMPNGSIIALPPNSVIELNLPGGVVGGGHPFHLHGHTFWVVRSAGSSTYNFNNPILRDTVNIGGLGDNVTIRFETNNPGPWFLHCHIDWHLDLGFAVVLAEDIPGIKPTNPVPLAWEKLCPLYNALAPGDL